MSTVLNIVTYTFLFSAVYIQIFLLMTLFENKNTMNKKLKPFCSKTQPTVTIMVPVFNEQNTVEKTINSLLTMNYPADRLKIMVIDDGSKDNTWNVIQKFSGHPQIELHQKENGGKYTALNYGINNSKSQFLGCLDADSFVDPEALNHIMPNFRNPKVMAVTPSLRIQNPDNILGLMQNAEYNMGIFIRKMFGLLDAQYVTPGPFSIFRRSVFKNIGMYRHAHNTEDLEMALRMQKHHYKIVNAHQALVYTVAPLTFYKLYKQRVRWTGGFMQNVLDYRSMILNPKYGNLGMFVLPAAFFAMIGTIFYLSYTLYRGINSINNAVNYVRVVGWHPQFSFAWPNIGSGWIYYHIQGMYFAILLMTCLVAFAIIYGKKLAGGNDKRVIDVILYLMFFSFIAPFWLVTSFYNTILSKDAPWR